MQLLVEKYRPQSLDAMVLDDPVRETFQGFIDKGEIPHLLLCGPPGTGKTTMMRILARSLDAEYKELNASDERGIDVVRDKIKKFAMVSNVKRWKLMLLDEADGVTLPAQQTLRNTIEKYARTVRFILTANYEERILDAIRSRMMVFRFDVWPLKYRFQVLSNILIAEKIDYNDDDVFQVLDDAGSDMRQAITMSEAMVKNGKLVYKSLKDKVDIHNLWVLIKEKRWQAVKNVLDGGVDSTYILERMFDFVFEEKSPELAVEIVGEYLYRDSVVINKKLNVLCCVIELGKLVW